MKSKINDLLIQVISVTIGVFLGFAISNWSEVRKETNKYNSLIENVESEIQSNKIKIEKVIDYHRMVRDSTRFYMMKKDLKGFKPGFFNGVNTLSFSNSAFQTGIQTGVFNKIDLNKIQAINDVYTKQRAYEEYSNILLSGFITMDFIDNDESNWKIATFLSISMNDVVIKEEQLLKSIDNALSVLNE
ncbi:hypothetical protein [Marinigracilibium pacificum]|uniref:Uncharacterized protein n=1 Tax=Marinigracilibium pacificum TaxID=2729599 RepID=A0A848IX84_9BACT|nr:hypothetical protein [Marinigracilibium pacificum]NMM47911.1 hypothetical protein [Marinigracilibium pacificum]